MSARRRLGAAFAASGEHRCHRRHPDVRVRRRAGTHGDRAAPGHHRPGPGLHGVEPLGGAGDRRPADRVGLTTPFASGSGVEGVDVSSYQRTVGWSGLYRRGVRFAYVKATEGRTYRNPYFHTQYLGPYRAGMSHGAYHFAIPNISGGATQASIFVAHGGGWTSDGRTLPGVLDIEYNPYGVHLLRPVQGEDGRLDPGLHHAATTGSPAVTRSIYTTLAWWRRCTGNSTRSTAQPAVASPPAAVGSARSRAAGRTRRSGSTPRPQWPGPRPLQRPASAT